MDSSSSKTYCCVPHCKNYAYKDRTISFHRFPQVKECCTKRTNDLQFKRCKEWVRLLKIQKKVSKSMRVCSKHFQPSDFMEPGVQNVRRRLKNTAVPSRNLPSPQENEVLEAGKEVLPKEDSTETSFPLTRPAVCKKWYTAMRRKNWFPTKASSLCSDHFVSDDFIPQLPGQNAKRLKLDAVPSQFDFTPVTPKNVKKQKKKKRILKPSKPEKVLDDKIKSKPEEEKYVKPNILYLTSADTNNYILPDSNNYILPDSNNFILPDSNEIKQNRTTLYETDELKSSEESNTETSSEAEDEMNLSDYDAYSDDSSHVLNSSIIPMSKEKLWLRLQNMTDRYERTLEKMEAYRENWKLCMKEVTVLQKIIDNLKEINSITDDR